MKSMIYPKTLLALSLLLSFSAMHAQISMDMIMKNRNLDVRLTVKDGKSQSPIGFASVYLVPAGDTTITEFSLSDKDGKVRMEEIPAGKYELNIEMMGYMPFKKVYSLKKWEEDLGDILMETDTKYLDAATVSAAGNPVLIKKDTIEFNASSFKVGQNAMLEDLLKKMPGMEIDENGTVRLNGEEIEKITVDGKTFFFKDSSAALKNLPARIVDKIKVMDKDNKSAEFTGIATKSDKEKVMDVELKEEFKKGWFGNVTLGGGAAIPSKEDNELVKDKGFLYNGNAMVTGYTEKDQIVFIGNAYNISDNGNARVMSPGGMMSGISSDYSQLQGLGTSIQTGLNWNTERIKGYKTNLSANYRHSTKDGRRKSSRESFLHDGSTLQSGSDYKGYGQDDNASISFELEKENTDKYMLAFYPNLSFNTSKTAINTNSETLSGEKQLNRTNNMSRSDADIINTGASLHAGIRDIGKKMRSLMASVRFSYGHGKGKKTEYNEFLSDKSEERKDLEHRLTDKNTSIYAGLSYTEPISEKWAFQTQLTSNNNISSDNDDAANAEDGTANDYYSSYSYNFYTTETLQLLAQYKFKQSRLLFGAQAVAVHNKIRSKSYNQQTDSPDKEWKFNWSPFAALWLNKNNHSAGIYYNGFYEQVNSSKIMANIDFSDPLQISVGNIYLRPVFRHYLNVHYSMNSPKTFTFLNLYASGDISQRALSDAVWFDEKGTRFAIPVNSHKPGSNIYINANLNQPFGKDRKFSFNVSCHFNYTGNTSYQAVTKVPGIDIHKFDYMEFMKGFWGDASGNNFYSGDSGFKESKTSSYSSGGNISLKYTNDAVDMKFGFYTFNSTSRYSLDKTADSSIWNHLAYAQILITPGKEWEAESGLSYRFYNGYSNGFGRPEWLWNLSVSKSIKAFTLSLKFIDLLNQTKNLNRLVSSEYIEETYSNVIGRRFMISVSYNFGKKNADKNKVVENAMWDMM